MPLRHTLLVGLFATSLLSQDWTDEQLVAACPGFQSESLTARLQQVGKLLVDRQAAFSAIVARIHGDHREYRLKIDRLIEELADARWQVREDAERSLIEIGGRARTVIQQRKEKYDVLEQHIRCGRVLDALDAKGTEQEDRERRLMRGLVTTALYLDPEPRLLRALRSALGHTDSSIAEGAIRALGKLGGDEEVDSVVQMVTFKSGIFRLTAVSALGRMRCDKALAVCRDLLSGKPTGPLEGVTLTRTESMAIVRVLHARGDAGAAALISTLQGHADPVLAAGARVSAPKGQKPATARCTLPDRSQVDASFGGFLGESQLVGDVFEGLPMAELSFNDCDTIDFSDHAVLPPTVARVFLNQGSLVCGEILAIDPEGVRVRSAHFGEFVLPRKEIQGIAMDPSLDRLIGASVEHDRVRLRSGEFLDGALVSGNSKQVKVVLVGGEERNVETSDVAGVLFTRPRVAEPDTTTYSRIDLVTGVRLIGFLADSSSDQLAVSVPLLGATAVPLSQVSHMELAVGGGAMWGFTLIADYSDNSVIEVDQGRVVFVLEDIFGAWDAECLDNGNLLITEFSVSRVQEVTRKGKVVWMFEDLKNPYDADRLPNGNTLIADTFASRVIEVSPEGKIVWSYAKDIRPFDCDRLPNGNTLIADVLKDRVIEVSPEGEIVLEVKNLPNCHDADRLPNGNTLVTLRNKGCVLEIDREGKVVWELQGLSSPSDADRLPNGNTLVAENTCVREFDRRGNVVWKKEMTWAVEANRY
ncbi:MAG: hypothetical protein ABIP94_13780 [Planctomycetota bacterium]